MVRSLLKSTPAVPPTIWPLIQKAPAPSRIRFVCVLSIVPLSVTMPPLVFSMMAVPLLTETVPL